MGVLRIESAWMSPGLVKRFRMGRPMQQISRQGSHDVGTPFAYAEVKHHPVVPVAKHLAIRTELGVIAARVAFGAPLPTKPGARLRVQARQAVILAGAVLVAVSPHDPWYFTWLAPLACIAPVPSVLWMLAAAPLLAHGAVEYLVVPGAVYGPAVILAVFDLRRSRGQSLAMPPPALRSA